MQRWSEPVIQSIDVGNRNAGKFFFRDTFQATNIDAVHFSNGRLGSNTKWTNAANSAEEVKVLASVELVLREFRLA